MTEHIIIPSEKTSEVPSYLITRDLENGDYKVNLLYLLTQIYKKRWLIMSITGLTTFATLLLSSLSVAPSYHAKIHLDKPVASQYQNIYTNLGITHFRIKSHLFNSFISMLNNKNNIMSFLDTSKTTDLMMLQKDNKKAPVEKSVLINKLLNNLSVKQLPDKTYELSMPAYDKQLSIDAAKAYITFTNKIVLDRLVKEQQAIANRKIKMLRGEINREIMQASYARKHEIKRLTDQQSLDMAIVNNQIERLKRVELMEKKLLLKELNSALKVAEKLGIKNLVPSNILIKGNSIETNEELPLRGTTYLKAQIAMIKDKPHSFSFEKNLSSLEDELISLKNNKQIESLKSRTTDVAYAPDIEEKLSKIKQLGSYSYNKSNIKSYKIVDQPVVQVVSGIKRHKLIILLGFFLGLLTSISIIVKNCNLIKPEEQNLLT